MHTTLTGANAPPALAMLSYIATTSRNGGIFTHLKSRK